MRLKVRSSAFRQKNSLTRELQTRKEVIARRKISSVLCINSTLLVFNRFGCCPERAEGYSQRFQPLERGTSPSPRPERALGRVGRPAW